MASGLRPDVRVVVRVVVRWMSGVYAPGTRTCGSGSERWRFRTHHTTVHARDFEI